MFNEFEALDPVLQALIAGLFTWGVTALGAGMVFLSRRTDRRRLSAMLGFASGIMIAASFFSLLLSAIEMQGSNGLRACIPAVIGFLAGGGFLLLLDHILPHIHVEDEGMRREGPLTPMRRTSLLVIAITMHNIPEGLAIGVAFGAAAIGTAGAEIGAAIALTIGIGLQNFPEGFAVSAPLRCDGCTKAKALWYGQLSAIVEPIAAVLGAFAVIAMQSLLPFALAFAAGAMIFVVGEELIPEARNHDPSDIPTVCLLMGFAIMMLLDVALG